jgi:hypothetical protein
MQHVAELEVDVKHRNIELKSLKEQLRKKE